MVLFLPEFIIRVPKALLTLLGFMTLKKIIKIYRGGFLGARQKHPMLDSNNILLL